MRRRSAAPRTIYNTGALPYLRDCGYTGIEVGFPTTILAPPATTPPKVEPKSAANPQGGLVHSDVKENK